MRYTHANRHQASQWSASAKKFAHINFTQNSSYVGKLTSIQYRPHLKYNNGITTEKGPNFTEKEECHNISIDALYYRRYSIEHIYRTTFAGN